MATPSRDSEPVSDDGASIIFIDTSLDTHLVVIVSQNDTVSDLKKRILSEHQSSFPKIGQIQIHAIKVKRRGYFYHLSDSMFIRSVFHGVNKNWFLYVDASALEEHGKNELLCSSGSPNQLACLGNASNGLIGPVDIAADEEKEEIPFVNPRVSKYTGKGSEFILETGANHELPSLQIEREVDGSRKGVKDDSNVCEEVSSISARSAKKSQKDKRKIENAVQDYTLKEKIASVDSLLNSTSKKVSSNDLQVPQLENKQDEEKEILFASPNVSESTGKELVKNLETGAKSSGKKNPGIPSSHIECEVDGSSIGVHDDRIVCGGGTSKSVQSVKKKQKSKRKKEDMVQYDTSKGIDGSIFGPGNDTVQRDIAVIRNPSENAEKETEVLKEHQHTECNNNNMMNDIDTESMKGASEPVHATNKKQRKRKRSLVQDSKEMSIVETISQKVEAEKSVEACKESKESKDQFEINNDKPPSKKKQKTIEKSGDRSSSKRNLSMMISDSIVDNASHQILEVQKKIKNSSADQTVEHLNNTDSLRTSEHGGRRKVKKKSSISHETHVVTSSGKGKEADPSSIQGGVQEEILEDGLISKDITMNKTTLGNVKIGTEVSPQNDPKPMLLEECTPSNQGNTDANTVELNVTSKVVEGIGMAEPVKSEKKKRRTKKAKNSDGGPILRDCVGPVDASESEAINVRSLKSTNCDPASGNTVIEENPLNHIEGENIQQEMKGTVISATDKEDNSRADNAGSSHQIKTTDNVEHVDKTQRKKSNNKQTSTSKSVSNMLTKDAVLDSKKPSPSSDISKITKKIKSGSTKSANKSSKRSLEPLKNSVVLEPSDSRVISGTPEECYNVGPFEGNGAAKDSARASEEKDDNNLEAPLKTNEINADQQFLFQQLQHEANMSDDILVDKMNGSDRKDLDLLTGQNADKREATKGQTRAENLSSSQKLSSTTERGVLRTHSDKKVPNVHKTGQEAKLSSRSNSSVSSIRENGKPQFSAFGKIMMEKLREGTPKSNSVLVEKLREGIPKSNSVLEGSKKRAQEKTGEASGNNVGGVVSKTPQKKSLLAGAIFKDDSSGTSEDVDEVDNSDASTRTPSNNSLLSDFSDGDSSAGLHGSHGGRSTAKSTMSSIEGLSLDQILRSSSKYKKAKITASQLDESESQPEFVPDSLA